MIKKRIALLLALMMVGGVAAGCTGSSGDDVAQGESVQAESGVQEGEEDAEEDAVQENDEDEEEEVVSAAEEFNFEELTLIDTEECVVKITSIGMDTDVSGDEVLTLTVYTENKSEERNCRITLGVQSVNGLANITGAYYFSEILPQKKANGEVEISMVDLGEYGVADATDIYVTCEVKDSDSWESLAAGSAHIYPYGEENAVSYNRDAQESDVTFADNEYITGIVTGYELLTDYYGEEVYEVELFLQSNTDLDLLFSISRTSISINECMMQPDNGIDRYLFAGNCTYFSLTWDKQDLDDNGIEAIESLGFIYSVDDMVDFRGSTVYQFEELTDETVTVTLE